MRTHWLFYLYAASSTGVLVAALVSIDTAFRRRWALTRRLGLASSIGALGVFAAGMLLARSSAFIEIDATAGTKAHAVYLVRATTSFMNVSAMLVPAFMIGVTTWLAGRAGQRRGKPSPR